jgi:hypothetical protein
MSILDKITVTGPKAPRITIYGRPGIGKSTLAMQFPSPLFLLTEEVGLIGVNSLPVVKTFDEMWKNIIELLKIEDLPYKTIVIDSISKLDALLVKYILDKEPPTKNGKAPTLNSACGGYGAGALQAQSLYRALKVHLDKFQERGIAVIYLSHYVSTKVKSPESEDYDMASIVMNSDKSREVFIDDVDAVLFCKNKTFFIETESGRTLAQSTGEHVIVTGSSDAYVAKNRYNMPHEIGQSFEEIAKYIPFYNQETEK